MKVLMIVLAVLGVALGWWLLSRPPLYRASAVLLIEQGAEPPMVPGKTPPAAPEEFYNTQYVVLRSRAVAQKLYGKMQMSEWPMFRKTSPDADRIAVVQRWIHVAPVPKTHMVEVWILWEDPVMAADMVNHVTDAYKEIVESDADAWENSVRVQVINKAEAPKARHSRFRW